MKKITKKVRKWIVIDSYNIQCAINNIQYLLLISCNRTLQ